MYILTHMEKLDEDLLEKSLAALQQAKWDQDCVDVTVLLLCATAEHGQLDQANRVLKLLNKRKVKLEPNNIARLILLEAALKTYNIEAAEIDKIGELIDVCLSNVNSDQESNSQLAANIRSNNADVSDVVSFIDQALDNDWGNRAISLGALHILLPRLATVGISASEAGELERLVFKTLLNIDLKSLIEALHQHRISGAVVSYDLALKLEKAIGVMADDIDWTDCGKLFAVMSGFAELRPKFLQLLLNGTQRNISAISEQDANVIAAFFERNGLEPSKLLPDLASKLVNIKHDKNSVDKLATALLTSNSDIQDSVLYGRTVLEYVNAVLALNAEEKTQTTQLSSQIIEAVRERQTLSGDQKAWALDTRALVVY